MQSPDFTPIANTSVPAPCKFAREQAQHVASTGSPGADAHNALLMQFVITEARRPLRLVMSEVALIIKTQAATAYRDALIVSLLTEGWGEF